MLTHQTTAVWWFGPRWPAPVCDECREALTPVDDRCLVCVVPIRLGDQGLLLAGRPPRRHAVHRACLGDELYAAMVDAVGAVDETVTYRLATVGGVRTIRCLLCGRASAHVGDIAHRYCGACHVFHDAVADARRMHRDGLTHGCAEWQTSRNLCAVCGAAVPTRSPN